MKPTKDDIRRRLGLREVPKPPDDLLRQLKADIPPSFRYPKHLTTDRRNDSTSAFRGMSWQVAASFLVLTLAGVGVYMVTFETRNQETAKIAEADRAPEREFSPPMSPSPAAEARAQETPKAQAQPSQASPATFAPTTPPPPPPAIPESTVANAARGTGGSEGGVEGGIEGGVLGGVVGGVLDASTTASDDYRPAKPAEQQVAQSRDKGYAEEKEKLAEAAPAAAVAPGRRDAKDERAQAPPSATSGIGVLGTSASSMGEGPVPPLPLNVGGDVKAPVVTRRVALVYPEEARQRQVEGIVIVEVIVDRDGNPKFPKVLKPLPYGLDQAAVEAVKQWKFKPATLHGKPVEVFFRVTVNAKLAR